MAFTVLIVDDSDVGQAAMQALLGRMGEIETVAFTRASQAMLWAQQHAVDLVIVDCLICDLSATEFIRQLRMIPGRATVPILVASSNDHKHIRYRALDAGATDFLSKPLDNIEFMARVGHMLQSAARRTSGSKRTNSLDDVVRKATVDIVQREQEAVIRLSRAAEYRDPETAGHLLRIAHYSALIASGMGLPKPEQEVLLEAAPLHDIGKVGVSDALLLKPGRLTEREFELMKMHTAYGYDILKDSSSCVLQTGAMIALGHHEKFDGTGYPNGLRGHDIPVVCRIVAVADVFDALTTERPYKKLWSMEQALAFVKVSAGTLFDPKCVAVFIANWAEVQNIRRRFPAVQGVQ